MLFTRYDLTKNHGEFVHLNMLRWALKYVPEFGKKTVTDDVTVKSMDIDKTGIDVTTADDETGEESTKHFPFSSVEVDGKPQSQADFKVDKKGDVRTVTFDDGVPEHFDRYTKVFKASGPDDLIPALSLEDTEKVNVDGVEKPYVSGVQEMSKDDDGNLTPGAKTDLKPYTSVIREDGSTASKVAFDHDDKNHLTSVVLPATGETYTVKQGSAVSDADKPDTVAETVQLKGDSNGNLTDINLSTGKKYTVKSGTSVSDADAPTAVAESAQLKGDSKGNLTSVTLSTGKTYTVPALNKGGTEVVDSAAPDTIAEKLTVTGDPNGNLSSVSLSNGKTYAVPAQAKSTQVVDSATPDTVTEKLTVTGDPNGNLTKVSLANGKSYAVPAQNKSGTEVIDSATPEAVADKLTVTGDSDGHLASVSLSNGKTYSVPAQKPSTIVADEATPDAPMQEVLLKHNDDGTLKSLVQKETGTETALPTYSTVQDGKTSQKASTVTFSGDSNDNLTAVTMSTGTTLKVPANTGSTGSGTSTPASVITRQAFIGDQELTKPDGAFETKKYYDRMSFTFNNKTTGEYGNSATYVDGIQLMSKGNDPSTVDKTLLRPYTEFHYLVNDSNGNNIGGIVPQVQLLSGGTDHYNDDGNYFLLNGLRFIDPSNPNDKNYTYRILRPFRLSHVWQKAGEVADMGSDGWNPFFNCDLMEVQCGNGINGNATAPEGQYVNSITLSRLGGAKFTIDLSSLKLQIKDTTGQV